MRTCGILICSVLLVAMVFLPGCTTQDTGNPAIPPAPEGVKGNPSVTPSGSLFGNVHLPLAMPTPRVVYVTVTVPVPTRHRIPHRFPLPRQSEPYARAVNSLLPASG